MGFALHLLLREGRNESFEDSYRDPIGLVIKTTSRLTFSEMNGGWRSIRLGPLYLRTYHRRPIRR